MSDSDTLETSENDQLYRFTFENYPVRGQWVRLTQTTQAAHSVNEYPLAIKKLLNEMFAVVAMFADNLKFDGAIALQSKGGDGALIRTLAECRERQFLRGIAHIDSAQSAPADSSCLARRRTACPIADSPGRCRSGPVSGAGGTAGGLSG
ncbi:MAG: Hsp33 family molecular chaperone HslO [Pseudomonadaceae bacterium]|nr:Hsp33 family molecular chaperone HslO [Pseudomonadaceae bacterium]